MLQREYESLRTEMAAGRELKAVETSVLRAIDRLGNQLSAYEARWTEEAARLNDRIQVIDDRIHVFVPRRFLMKLSNLQENRPSLLLGVKVNLNLFMNNQPKVITEGEWQEIVRSAPVREAWGLEYDPDPSEFASRVYGAKFDFVSGGPGYVGDIFVLQGDAIGEVPPMVLRRDRQNRLIVC